jgi:EAL domain-containing protein (putative c-di-GMP-specific phosphodiesterase class I)
MAILEMARGLSLRVIAEGVETEEQLAFLTANGCRQAQGYLFGPPVPVSTLTGNTR